jgi:hypothetical protein
MVDGEIRWPALESSRRIIAGMHHFSRPSVGILDRCARVVHKMPALAATIRQSVPRGCVFE